MNFLWQVYRFTFCNLQYLSKSSYQVEAAHGNRHTTLGNKLGRIPTATEVAIVSRIPGGSIQTCICFFFTYFPERFHHRFAIPALLSTAIHGSGARVNKMNK